MCFIFAKLCLVWITKWSRISYLSRIVYKSNHTRKIYSLYREIDIVIPIIRAGQSINPFKFKTNLLSSTSSQRNPCARRNSPFSLSPYRYSRATKKRQQTADPSPHLEILPSPSQRIQRERLNLCIKTWAARGPSKLLPGHRDFGDTDRTAHPEAFH